MPYPNFLQDREGLERWRKTALEGSGHDMADVNKNTLYRFVQTVDVLEARLKAVGDAAGVGQDPRPNLAAAVGTRIKALEGALRDLLTTYDAEDASGNHLPLEHQAWDAPIDNARATLAGFAPSVTPSELERLRALVYRPGVLRCAKCQFRLIRNVFHVQDGAISAGNSESEPCPNGCGPLWPVTWKEECQAADALWDQQFARAVRAETLLTVVAETLKRIVSSSAGLGGEIRCEAVAALRTLEREDALALRPMADAPRDRPISARVTTKPGVLPERWAHSGGLWFTIRHGGVIEGGYDMGWQYPGHGGMPDHWFEGWWPLPSDDIDPTPQSSPA